MCVVVGLVWTCCSEVLVGRGWLVGVVWIAVQVRHGPARRAAAIGADFAKHIAQVSFGLGGGRLQ